MSRTNVPVVVLGPKVEQAEPCIPKDCEYLTYQQAGRKIGVSEKTVREYCRQGRLPRIKLGYRTVRIPSMAVDEFMERERLKEQSP